ncbi:glycosyltransferase family 39 protein [Streptomyces sp. OUCMDZ-4982]|uniref:glycosyltransferase family 39 protein n=1 Tax=Streptomyces sp. OUCMDZ-4982 TaxID=2973090 RepID=UPI00215C23F4|nr:glycosyltransferase family 39 protein [Streptomyces sp. OUCMDZ-4982]MCR8946772.1 glycosyltransferase family 39 protein [Streptomyces sp. OUCMDZ-4982]
MRPSSPRPLLVRSIPALWTLALGLWGLSRQDSVWRDEAATWQVARRSTAEITQMLGNVDVVHGLYYLLMHGLFDLFGPGTAVLRLPSVVAMAVAAACVAALGHRLAGPWAGLGGGVALGLLPTVQFYLQEGRPYALVAAGAGVSTLLLVTLLEGRGRAVHWVAYGGTVAVSGLLNWLSLLILPAHLATLLWCRAGRGTGRRWTAAAVAAVVCVLPLVLFSRSQSAQVSWIPPLTWHMLIGPAILLAIGGAGALLDRPRPRPGRLSVAAVGLPLLAVPQLGLVGLSLIQPLFLDRYVLFSLLGLALLIGVAIGAAVRAVARRRPRAAPWILPVVVAVAVAALLPQVLAKRSPASRVDDVLAAAADVRRMKSPGDVVLFIPAARRDTALVSPDAFSGLQDIALAESPEESATLKGTEARPDRIRSAMLAHHRILLVTDAPGVARPPATARDRMKRSVLRDHFRITADGQVRGRRVTVYERRATAR